MSNSHSVSIILKAEICQKGHHYSMFTAGQVTHVSAFLPDPVTSQLLPFFCIELAKFCQKNDKRKIKAQKGELTPYKQRSLRIATSVKFRPRTI